MDWNLAIEGNRDALKRILASLVAMAALTGGAPTLTRRLHHAVARLLRPAEAAARRLIVLAARGLVVPPPPPPRPSKPGPNPSILRNGVGTGIILPRGVLAAPQHPTVRSLSLPLFDPLRLPRRWRPMHTSVPRILFPGLPGFAPARLRQPPRPDDPVNGARLALRMQAIGSVLDDLPRHALRLARLRAVRKAAAALRRNPQNFRPGRRFHRDWPLKPGHPPGWRRNSRHEVHDVLDEVHGLAIWALEKPDTS